jgi:cytochrome b561
MRFRNSADGYGAIAQSLHWLTVVLVAMGWTLGTFDDVLPKGVLANALVMLAAFRDRTLLVRRRPDARR